VIGVAFGDIPAAARRSRRSRREILGEHATARSVAALNHSWGLDRSLWHQFVRYIGDLARLRLGNSFVSGTSVTSLIAARIGQTAALVGIATVFAVLITVPLAAVAASHRDRVQRPRGARPLRGGARNAFLLGRNRADRGSSPCI